MSFSGSLDMASPLLPTASCLLPRLSVVSSVNEEEVRQRKRANSDSPEQVKRVAQFPEGRAFQKDSRQRGDAVSHRVDYHRLLKDVRHGFQRRAHSRQHRKRNGDKVHHNN